MTNLVNFPPPLITETEMRSNHLKIVINCLIISAILIASVRAQQYATYTNYAQQQSFQYPQAHKVSTQQFLTSDPAPPAQALPAQSAFSLNARQNSVPITQIVEGSEQFTFDMIYVS